MKLLTKQANAYSVPRLTLSAYPFPNWKANGRNILRCKRVTVSGIMTTSKKWTT
ncbi:hypothetical protein NXX39_17885 [Bacteroides ovatus]|uniref:Uncharacterized protein n=1 Tax=Bacteroides thetaiotaomicron TaxID=818 RepID=A0A943HQ45_BACT4|nr:hypothetical protein [Bacteroides ovatus]MBS5411894.1 hypothetical protein [Bacteroides thetaiotaomicron]MCS2474975.1 hypothetical protein [Bacteroides ovatus]UBF10925.1 hypothetical protein K6V23_27615 [Bacteroides ovatus]